MASEKRREIRVESVNLINDSALETGDNGGPPEATLYLEFKDSNQAE